MAFIYEYNVSARLIEHEFDHFQKLTDLSQIQQTKSMRCKVLLCSGASLADLQKSDESGIRTACKPSNRDFALFIGKG